MSRINDLIKELCPNGVKKYKLQDIVKFENGKGHERVVNEYGKYILLTSKAISTNLKSYRRTDEQLSPLYKDDITMVMSDLPNGKALAKCFLVDQDNLYTLNQRICRLTLNDQNILPKYLYYLLNRNCQLLQYDNGVDQTNLRKNDILKVELLIPPLEVQEEIVKILDKFGELEAELEVELEAELEARKNQYEFWRGTIISNSNVKDGKLIELLSGPITDGPHTTPKFLSEGIPFISASAVHEGKIHLKDAQGFITKEFDNECSRKYKPRKWDVYMVKSGSTTGKIAIVDIDADFNIWSPLAAMRTDNEITSRYLYHLLQTKDVQEQVRNRMSHGSQPNLSMRVLEQFDIKIPTLEEQHCIVNILDKFDKLINDISVGLHVEIKLRREQYEYYKNKLLSFEEFLNE